MSDRRAALDHVLVLLETGRPQMALTVLQGARQTRHRTPATTTIRELEGRLGRARQRINDLAHQLVDAERRAREAERKLARAQGRRPPMRHDSDRRRLAHLIERGQVTPAAAAVVLRVREADVVALAEGRVTLAPTSWRRLWAGLVP